MIYYSIGSILLILYSNINYCLFYVQINLPSNVKKELENNGDSSLTPMVIESVYNQAFITRKRIKPDFTMRKLNKHIRKYLFKKELQSLIKGNALEINRKMSMKAFNF